MIRGWRLERNVLGAGSAGAMRRPTRIMERLANMQFASRGSCPNDGVGVGAG